MKNKLAPQEEQERYLQGILRYAPAGAFYLDQAGNCCFINKELESISGLTLAEALGQGWTQNIFPDDLPKIKEAIQEAGADKPVSFSFRIDNPLKGIRYCKANIWVAEAGCVVGYVLDETDEKQEKLHLQEAEKQLEQSNRILDVSQELSKTGGWEYDLVTRKITWTRQVYMIYEVPEDFDTSDPDKYLSFFKPQDREIIVREMQASIEHKTSYMFEAEATMYGGSIKWVKVFGVPVLKEEEVVGLRGAVMDITQQKENELALSASRAELEQSHLIMDVSQELSKTGGWEYNALTGEVFWTKQTYLINGMEFHFTPTYEAVLSFCDEAYRPFLDEAVRLAIEEGRPYDLELKFISSGGDKWIRAIGTPIMENGQVILLRGAIADITEKKRNERALINVNAALERSNLLLDISQKLGKTGGWEYDLMTGQITWTKQTYAIYGISEDFVPTLDKVLAFFSEHDQHTIMQSLQDITTQKKSFTNEVKFKDKWLLYIGMPVLQGEDVVMIRGALTDITQTKESELALTRAKVAAEEAAKAKADFLSIMSHEIRTPLNGIIGIANLLKLSYAPEQEEYINSLVFSSDHLLQLINDVLDLNKIDQDKLELVFAEVNVTDLVNHIKKQFNSLAEEKGLTLSVQIDKNIPRGISADPIRLIQILNNLVSNAIKYTEKGEVVLSAQVVASKNDKVTLHFSVKDTGIGIPASMHETIFESFRQVGQPPARTQSGTGLGLTITRKLVELHKSNIFLESSPGKGSTFYFELTFDRVTGKNKPAGPRQISELSSYANKFTGMRVLFVEDNPINIMVAQNHMKYFGIIPDCAQGGEDALLLLQEHTYDVAFLDLHMPGMDGYELSTIVRQQYPDTHIVIFTADIMIDIRRRFAKMGIFDILNKPFFPREMLSTLLKIAQIRKMNIK